MPHDFKLPENMELPKIEETVLEEWRKNNTFQKSLELSKDRPHYTFYDGPPFATGLPHYGHILAGTIKDVVTRYAHQTGHYVERRFGWDTHGLPVEFEVDNTLGIKGPADVHAMGIDKYNDECRSIVMRYATQWKETVERMGRWIDFDNDYKTLYPSFMESEWWVFSELYKKGLVYQGVKVMPYSTGCSTPLSNFEAGQNYKDVSDPAVFVAFPLKDQPNRRLIAWTTTPWTLPSNLALCVHPDLEYAIVQPKDSDVENVLLESCLKSLYKKPSEYTIIGKLKGSDLKGKKYIPPFNYFEHLNTGNFFHVLTGTFVTTDQGTGVVHQAPYFGEIDYSTCIEHGVITKDMKMICPVDEKGRFTPEVTDFENLYVKDADKLIITDLKNRKLLLRQDNIVHSYPYCWRSDTPLLYKAVPSWFIKVEQLIPDLLKNNEKTLWVPSFVQEKRFANWLRDARDWAVSRNRFWGTPINLWISDDMEEVVCPASIEELENLTGEKITDIHRQHIDHLTIPSKKGKGVLKRVSEVFDCWFESGSMPYASQHYPFENAEKFEANFPADFIAEGIDQTRGWFYTLLVLSTALFNKPPFKNLICNGLVLASDGTKMSKRKKNYPDPMEIAHRNGADPLRLYLINSPVVRGDNLRFREEGVKEVVKDVFLPWYNAYRFFLHSVRRFEEANKKDCKITIHNVENIMDKWILSYTNSLVKLVRKEMESYRLYAVVGPLVNFFEALTNCYIRLNRSRLKGDNVAVEDHECALFTLGHVLVIITRLMAPFTPFFTEYLWQTLRVFTDHTEESVHFVMLPEVEENYIDADVERRVAAMRSVIDIVRVLRERKNIGVRYPLSELVVVNRSKQFLEDVDSLEKYILAECNVKKITTSDDNKKYGVILKPDINFKVLAARLKKDQKDVANYLKAKVTQEELVTLLDIGKLSIGDHYVTSDEVSVVYTFDASKLTQDSKQGDWETQADHQSVVMLNSTLTEDLLCEGLLREIINRVQQLRKAANRFHLQSTTIHVIRITENSLLERVLQENIETIGNLTNSVIVKDNVPEERTIELSQSMKIKEFELDLCLLADE